MIIYVDRNNVKLLGISRSACFSPNSEERDAAIFAAVSERLRLKGVEVKTMTEDEGQIETLMSVDGIFSMGRSLKALNMEFEAEKRGIPVCNTAKGRMEWSRFHVMHHCEALGIACPRHVTVSPENVENPPLPFPFWLKRDDGAAQQADDVCFVRNREVWNTKRQSLFDEKGARWACEEHLQGDLIKFYGVAGSVFFHFHYPTSEAHGFSKFGAEKINGRPKGLHFDMPVLKKQTDFLAESMGLPVYGGDAVVTSDGRCCLIDFNDWPSFSVCREDAAEAIASYIMNHTK